MTKSQKQYQAAIKARNAALENLRRLTVARIGGAPDVSFDDVGHAACESMLTELEMQEARDALFGTLDA
jgi:hypothetical protein